MTISEYHNHPGIERRLDRLDQRLDRFEGRLDRIETNLERVLTANEQLLEVLRDETAGIVERLAIIEKLLHDRNGNA